MHPWSLMKDDQSESPLLHVHWSLGHPVLVHHALGVAVVEGRPFLHVRQHGRVTHPEHAVLSTSVPMDGEHVQERVLVHLVVTFPQYCGAVLVGGSKTIIRLAVQTHEPVTVPLHVEQIRCHFVVRSARLTARLVTGPRQTGESTAHMFVLTFVATFRREPFGAVPE